MNSIYRFDAGRGLAGNGPRRLPSFRLRCAGLLLVMLQAAVATALTNTQDPAGDTFGVGLVQHDIISVNNALTTSELTFEIEFLGTISQPTAFQQNVLAGFVDFDLDANPATGTTSNITQFGQGPSGLGVEFFVDLFSEGDALLADGMTLRMPGQVDLVDTSTFTAVAVLTADYGPASLSITIPRDLLTGMVLPFHWGILVGTLDEATDQLLGSTVPEPSSALLLMCCALLGPFMLRPRDFAFVRCVRPV